MTLGLILGAIIFLACALLGEKNMLYVPAVVLMLIAAANVLAGPLLP